MITLWDRIIGSWNAWLEGTSERTSQTSILLRGNWTPAYFLTNIRIEQIHGRRTQGQVEAWPLTKATSGRGWTQKVQSLPWGNGCKLQSTHSRDSSIFFSPFVFPGRLSQVPQLTDKDHCFFLGHKDDPNLFSPCSIFLTDVSSHVSNGQGLDAGVQVLSVPEALCKRFTVEADFRPWVFPVIFRIPRVQ